MTERPMVIPTSEEAGPEGEIKLVIAQLEELLPKGEKPDQVIVCTEALKNLLDNYPEDGDGVFKKQAQKMLEQAQELIKAKKWPTDNN